MAQQVHFRRREVLQQRALRDQQVDLAGEARGVALVVPDRGDVEVQTVEGPAEPPKRLEELQKLTELRTAGSLSDDEFEAEKARILKQA